MRIAQEKWTQNHGMLWEQHLTMVTCCYCKTNQQPKWDFTNLLQAGVVERSVPKTYKGKMVLLRSCRKFNRFGHPGKVYRFYCNDDEKKESIQTTKKEGPKNSNKETEEENRFLIFVERKGEPKHQPNGIRTKTSNNWSNDIYNKKIRREGFVIITTRERGKRPLFHSLDWMPNDDGMFFCITIVTLFSPFVMGWADVE